MARSDSARVMAAVRHVAERPGSELEPTSNVDGSGPSASLGPLAASAPPHATATDAHDVGEQICRLQALAELRVAGILTDAELTDLKRRVLWSGSDAPPEARHAGMTQAPHIGGPESAAVAAAGNGHARRANTQGIATAANGVASGGVGTKKASNEASGLSAPTLGRRGPKASYVTALKVVGMVPIVCRAGGNARPLYVRWKKALAAAAAEAAAKARPTDSDLFSLRIELRQLASNKQGSDLDNYVKPIQDSLAERGVFGPAARGGSTMKGDERVDHLDVRRRRVSSEAEVGVLAEVWALDA